MNVEKIRQFIGNIATEQLFHASWCIGESVLVVTPLSLQTDLESMKNHAHPSYSFIVPFDDFHRLSVEERSVPSVHGKIQVLSPDILHHSLEREEPSRYLQIFITKGFFEKLVTLYSYDAIPSFKGELFEMGEDLMPILGEFTIEGKNQMPGFEKVMEGLEEKIGHSLIRSILSMKVNRYPITHRFEINKVFNYIHDHYQEDIDVSHMALQIGLSTSHFTRIFRDESGYSPMDFLIHLRLQKARDLLRKKSTSITEIAQLCGFNSISYFSASFHKAYKMSPSHYRKAHKKS